MKNNNLFSRFTLLLIENKFLLILSVCISIVTCLLSIYLFSEVKSQRASVPIVISSNEHVLNEFEIYAVSRTGKESLIKKNNDTEWLIKNEYVTGIKLIKTWDGSSSGLFVDIDVGGIKKHMPFSDIPSPLGDSNIRYITSSLLHYSTAVIPPFNTLINWQGDWIVWLGMIFGLFGFGLAIVIVAGIWSFPNQVSVKNIFFKKINKPLSYGVVILFFIYLFTQALAAGGRWDMYEPIAMADRWINGNGFSYSLGPSDGYQPSTPYFPGVAMVAVVFAKIFTSLQVEFMLFFAVFLVIALLYVLYYIYKIIGGINNVTQFVASSIIISYFWLSSWLAYARELKPDTISLIIFLLALLLIFKKQKTEYSFLKYATYSVGILLLITTSLLFKQQIVAPIAGIFLGLLLSINRSNWKTVLSDLAMIGLGVVLCLAIVISIPGGLYFSILSHLGRGNVSIFDLSHAKYLAIMLLIIVVGRLFFRRTKDMLAAVTDFTKRNRVYTLCAVLWLLAGIAGARNVGGNIGNTAVGTVLFLPIIGLLVDKISAPIKSFFYATLMILLAVIIGQGAWLQQYTNRVAIEDEIAHFLISTNQNTNVIISADSYIAARKAKAMKIAELDTWGHIYSGINRKNVAQNGNEFIEQVNPDAIIIMNTAKLFDTYYQFDPSQYGYKEIKLLNNTVDDVLYVKN